VYIIIAGSLQILNWIHLFFPSVGPQNHLSSNWHLNIEIRIAFGGGARYIYENASGM
jgi:hypothetical protein